MYKFYKLGQLVKINDTNKVGFVVRETRYTNKTNKAITWVCILDEDFESPFLDTALSMVDT